MRALGIDVGLSGVRATIVDEAGRLLAAVSQRDAVTVAHGRSGHDPRRWRAAMVSAARAALAEAGPVDAIGIGALGPAPFLVGGDGEPASEALLFSLDSRAEREQEELGLTGDHALPKLRWLAERHPGAARASDVAGWIAEQLTGRPTMDAVTRLAWTPERGLPVPIPDPVDPFSQAPLATGLLGLPLGTPVVAGTYDSYVDVVAAGCRTPGDGCVLLGSTLVVYGVAPAAVEVEGLDLQAYPGEGFLLGGSTSSGGNVLDWARRTFGEEVAPTAGGDLRVLPYLAGERTPVRDAHATGAILGISLATTPAELHRAVVDALALAALDHAERIGRAVTVGSWTVSGGGVRNAAWLQATADALAAPVVLAPLAGDGAGPALFALLAMGVALPVVAARRIQPDPTEAARFTVAIVTGASSGIGRACAELLRDRHEVLGTSRTGGEGTFVADLATEEGCRSVIEEGRRRGPIAALVCSAGIGSYMESPIWSESVELWRESLAIHLDAPFHLIRLAFPDMMAARFGRIVVVSSTAATVGAPAQAAYSASKAGVLGLVRSVAQDGAPYGITCNAVLPGWVRSAMSEADAVAESGRRGGVPVDEIWHERAASYAAGRVVEATEVASMIGYLVSADASGVSGEEVRVALGGIW